MPLSPACLRMLVLCCGVLAAESPARAEIFSIGFTAVIGTMDSVDTDNLFRQGVGADLSGQTVAGSVSIDTPSLTQGCGAAPACYNDAGTGAIAISLTIGGVTQGITSSLSGAVGIKDPTNGGSNYLSILARSPGTGGNVVEEELGALFDAATLFSAYGGGDASNADTAGAIGSLSAIGGGSGLVWGGVTLMTADGEHLDAKIAEIAVDEPGSMATLAAALASLAAVFRLRVARRRSCQRA